MLDHTFDMLTSKRVLVDVVNLLLSNLHIIHAPSLFTLFYGASRVLIFLLTLLRRALFFPGRLPGRLLLLLRCFGTCTEAATQLWRTFSSWVR